MHPKRLSGAGLACCLILLVSLMGLRMGESSAFQSARAYHPQVRTRVAPIRIHATRQADSDLEVSGMLTRLPAGSVGYVTYAELTTLPQTTIWLHGDENFPELRSAHGLRITGVLLEVLAPALGAQPTSDLIDATCTDDYQAHYPAGYIAAHHPLFGLTIDGENTAKWAARTRRYDPSPYFVTHSNFVPSFSVLAHRDQPQVPSNVVRLNFSTTSAAYGAIAPRGPHAQEPAVQQGFVIAKQNCFRCHYQGPYGGTKSGRSWSTVATWASEQPAFFANYVHDPQAFEPHAHMPANLEYDGPTLAALTAYFQTFGSEAAGHAKAR